MNKINLVMPMGGSGSRFSEFGFSLPKPLIEINGHPFFYWATISISKFVELENLIFVVLQEHIDNHKIDEVILSYFSEAKIVVLKEVLNGAVLTCLKGVEIIDNNYPIVFNDCDHMFTCSSFYEFCEKSINKTVDGGMLTFQSEDPKFSYAATNELGYVTKTYEKKAISNQAICGAYYFKNKETFVDASNQYLNNCQYSEFFVSGVFNELIEKGKKIVLFQVDMHTPFGTPEEYSLAKGSSEFLRLK